MHPVKLFLHNPEVLPPVGSDSTPIVDEERQRLVVQVDRSRRPTIMVEHPTAKDQLAHEVGTLKGSQQGDDRPVAVTEYVCRAADDLLKKRDRIPCHLLVGYRTLDVGRAAVSAPVGPGDVEVVRELGHVLLDRPRVRKSRVQEYECLALAVLLVVGVDVAELYVVGHPSCSFSCLDLRAGVAQQDEGTI